MMRRVFGPVGWLWLACAIVGIALHCSIPADATPAADYAEQHAADVCIALDENPTVRGLLLTMQAVQDTTGMSDHDSARAVARSVIYVCSIHHHLITEATNAFRNGAAA